MFAPFFNLGKLSSVRLKTDTNPGKTPPQANTKKAAVFIGSQRGFAVVGFAYLQAGLTDGRVARQVGADDGRYPFVLAVAAAGRIINYD